MEARRLGRGNSRLCRASGNTQSATPFASTLAVVDLHLTDGDASPLIGVLSARGIAVIVTTGGSIEPEQPDLSQAIAVLQKPYRESDLITSIISLTKDPLSWISVCRAWQQNCCNRLISTPRSMSWNGSAWKFLDGDRPAVRRGSRGRAQGDPKNQIVRECRMSHRQPLRRGARLARSTETVAACDPSGPRAKSLHGPPPEATAIRSRPFFLLARCRPSELWIFQTHSVGRPADGRSRRALL